MFAASAEGIAMIENIMEYIAFSIGKDPIQVRLSNMGAENNPFPDMIDQFKSDSEYDRRYEEVRAFNKQNRWMKRALKLMPMTFEIYYFGNYNSVVSIYHADASVVICHGGIAMGQGLNTKVAQVCAYVLGIPMDKIKIKPSTSLISPNAMVTGGSIGSECVAFATKKACEILLERLAPIREKGKGYFSTFMREDVRGFTHVSFYFTSIRIEFSTIVLQRTITVMINICFIVCQISVCLVV